MGSTEQHEMVSKHENGTQRDPRNRRNEKKLNNSSTRLTAWGPIIKDG